MNIYDHQQCSQQLFCKCCKVVKTIQRSDLFASLKMDTITNRFLTSSLIYRV